MVTPIHITGPICTECHGGGELLENEGITQSWHMVKLQSSFLLGGAQAYTM